MSEMIYQGFRQGEMEFQYNPRVSVPEYPELARQKSVESRKVRERLKSFLNVAYGETPRQTLDIFAANKPGGPVLVFIHGGYWRSGNKEDNCGFVPTFTDRGATVVVMEYDLCPEVTVTDIVKQTRAAIAWTYRNIMRYGGNPSKIYVSGHSAGGHLTAMALAHDWQKEGLAPDLIKGATPTSGVFDLDMVMHVSPNEQIRMTSEIAKLNSPFLHPLRAACPVIVAVGSAEPKGWQQMSEDYFQFCKEQGLKCDYLLIPGANHYTLSDHLADPNSTLAQAMLKQMGLQAGVLKKALLH